MTHSRSYLIAALLAASAAVSCHGPESPDFVPCRLAEAALSDTSSFGYKAMASADGGNDGAIAVFGGFDETAVIAEKLLTADMFDNIDGKECRDTLPDFAGETVMPLFDVANAPYSGYVDAMNEDFLKEAVLNCFWTALSRKCSSTAFDRSMSKEKPAAKLVIFSSSVLAAFGCQDAEYLLSETGSDIGVLDAVSSSLSNVMAHASVPSNVGVWAAGDIISSGVYGNGFRSVRALYADRESPDYREWAGSAEAVCLSPERGGNAAEDVISFLDSYIAAEYSMPLSGVVVDDPDQACLVDSMNVAVAALMASEAPETEIYRSVMAPGFAFLSPADAVVADCYRWLRKNNRFTHVIAYPDVDAYVTVPSSEVNGRFLADGCSFTPDFKYNRAPGSDVVTFRTVPFSLSSLDLAMAERMRVLAPVTYNKLVYVY